MRIGWHVGADTDWAFAFLSEHIMKATPEHEHVFNEQGNINVVLSPVYLPGMETDKSFLLHLDGNRFYEARGVDFCLLDPPKSGRPRIISLIWMKDVWSWGVIYQVLHARLCDEFDFYPVEFERYRQSRAFVPSVAEDVFFCQNVTQLGSVPEHKKRLCVARLGGIMNFTDNAAVNQFMAEMGKCGAIVATNRKLYEIGKLANPNTYLIPNGLDLREWRPRPDRHWNVDQPIVGFIGNVATKAKVQYKGYDLVTRACRDLKLEVRPALYKSQQIPHEEMRERFFDQIDIFILPTDGEGCSNSIMEALACGVPVITTRTAGYHGELMQDGTNVVFCEKKIDGVKESLRRFVGHRGLFLKLSENGRHFAEEHHDINRIAERYREVFRKHFLPDSH